MCVCVCVCVCLYVCVCVCVCVCDVFGVHVVNSKIISFMQSISIPSTVGIVQSTKSKSRFQFKGYLWNTGMEPKTAGRFPVNSNKCNFLWWL